MDTVKKITNLSVSKLSDEHLLNLPMYENQSYSFQENEMIEASINFIQWWEIFAGSLI